jgi:tRNA (adenine-N(1)-)-methyltransferase non-catalytic subunit
MTSYDPLLSAPSMYVRENDHVVLVFADGRHILAQCCPNKPSNGGLPPMKINKRSYTTQNLIGLHYGTVLELSTNTLKPLPEGEDLIPDHPNVETEDPITGDAEDMNESVTTATRDNRSFIDTDTSQALGHIQLQKLRDEGAHGSQIVSQIIQNSSTYAQKTDFSKQKYVTRKQLKYQPRCRLTRCTSSTICSTLFLKDPKKILNLRSDTLAQILAYSNVSAGCQVLVMESCQGLVTGSFAQRMGGYGKILSVYAGQQPSSNELLNKFNLSFAETSSIKWVHAGDVFEHGSRLIEGGWCQKSSAAKEIATDFDPERTERQSLQWPCVLQSHTRAYLKTITDQEKFLAKRAARFARKLTRHSPLEAKGWLAMRQSDSLVIACRYDPTETLLRMFPYLAPSCPFVVYCEFIEPLTECFKEIQRLELAINLRLSDTWTREYQVLPGRTHPNMNMSQSGGFILCGTKLDPETGKNHLDEDLLKEIRAEIGGRRGKKPANGKSRKHNQVVRKEGPDRKRVRVER